MDGSASRSKLAPSESLGANSSGADPGVDRSLIATSESPVANASASASDVPNLVSAAPRGPASPAYVGTRNTPTMRACVSCSSCSCFLSWVYYFFSCLFTMLAHYLPNATRVCFGIFGLDFFCRVWCTLACIQSGLHWFHALICCTRLIVTAPCLQVAHSELSVANSTSDALHVANIVTADPATVRTPANSSENVVCFTFSCSLFQP